jgi:hypothetical protein
MHCSLYGNGLCCVLFASGKKLTVRCWRAINRQQQVGDLAEHQKVDASCKLAFEVTSLQANRYELARKL